MKFPEKVLISGIIQFLLVFWDPFLVETKVRNCETRKIQRCLRDFGRRMTPREAQTFCKNYTEENIKPCLNLKLGRWLENLQGRILAEASPGKNGGRGLTGRKTRKRKEYRNLTEGERNEFHRAINLLKADTSIEPNMYDAISSIHCNSMAKVAHEGPTFFIWHRLYLLLFERALEEKIPTVTLPYWDYTIDAELGRPENSEIWTASFMGNGQGRVVTGPFAHWVTDGQALSRNLATCGRIPTRHKISRALRQRHLGNISLPFAKYLNNLEYYHNSVHVWIGGTMEHIPTAPADPVFWLLHSFMDFVWYSFQDKQRSDGIRVGDDYPSGLQGNYSFDSPIGIFPMSIRKALRLGLDATDQIYEYVSD